jgi:uncharacterized protein YecT (DUF1311 family)
MRYLVFIVLSVAVVGAAFAQEERPICEPRVNPSCDCEDSRNELERSFCFGAKRDMADERLNKLYGGLIKRLSPEGKARLREAQRAWLKFRDAECLYAVGGPSLGIGSGRNSQMAICDKEVTERRIEDMERHVDCTVNGCPE